MEKNDEWETVEVSQNEDKVEYEMSVLTERESFNDTADNTNTKIDDVFKYKSRLQIAKTISDSTCT